MSAKDTGPLDWRIAIVDKSGRPTQEFQRKWATQRANNALIGSITFGTGAPTGTPDDGAEYVDTTKEPWVFYIGENSVWNIVGVQDFTDLGDVPGNYTSSGGKLVRVNGNTTGLEFDSLNSILDSTFGNTTGDLIVRGNTTWEVLGAGTAGFVLTSGGPGAPLVWASGSGPPPATPHRYWRVLVTTTGSGLPVLAEIGFMTTIGGSTVTTGGTAIADSTFGSFSAAQAFDGNAATDWATGSGGAGVGYIGYDFGSGNDQSIVEMYMQASATFTGQAPSAFDVQWSDTGTSWTTLLSATAASWTPGLIQRFH